MIAGFLVGGFGGLGFVGVGYWVPTRPTLSPVQLRPVMLVSAYPLGARLGTGEGVALALLLL